METIKLVVGKQTTDITERIHFEGERVAICHATTWGDDHPNLGVDQTLYINAQGDLIVQVAERDEFMATTWSVHKVIEADLDPGGKFDELGKVWRKAQEWRREIPY